MSPSENQPPVKFAICLAEDEQGGDLTRRKIYQVISDAQAESHGYLRVIDDSGEDYLYSAGFFLVVALPAEVTSALLEAA